MCAVSMVGDVYTTDFDKRRIQTWAIGGNPSITINGLPPTRQEFNVLKKEVELMKKMLEAAVKYDEENNEPHCEMEDKVVLLKKIAEAMGVDLGNVFKQD